MQTPRVPVSWAWALAANAPTSSCRTPIHSSRSSRRMASVTGLRASPTTPQTWRTPRSARASTICSAMVVTGPPVSGTSRVRRRPSRRPSPAGGSVEQLPRLQPVVELGVGLGRGVVDPAVQHRGRELLGAAEPHRPDDPLRLGNCCLLVTVHALGLVRHVQGPGPPGVLGRDADRALVGVALLGLDAAGGHHHRPGGVGVVRALRDPLDDVDPGGHLAAGADLDRVPQPGADQGVVQRDQPVGQRHADVVLELQRRCARAALGAVDDDEVRRDPLGPDRLDDGQQLASGADAELEAGRLAAGQLPHPGDEEDQLARGLEDPVGGRADALLTLRHASGVGDLLGHLGRRAARRRCPAWRLG